MLSNAPRTILQFGPFRLDPEHRALLRQGAPVALSSRAFDILVLLVERRGRVVTKDEIMASVWRGMIVEENNLAVQISALRRALADGADGPQMIMTIPGQGYRFVGRLDAPDTDPAPPKSNLPRAGAAVASTRPPARRRFYLYAACVALAVPAALLLWRGAPPPAAPAAPPRLSIAVLPFRDLSDDRCCDYLADAIDDDLTTDLSHIPGSVVIARESSDAFRGRALPTADIGRTLNVRYLLEGSLRASENRFSINAQLIEAATGGHLWAQRFDVPRDHLAQAQDTIVHRLASALGVTLVNIEGSASLREHAQNPDALDLFLRARSILDRSDTLESLTQAQHLLEQAVARQPGFTEAQAELAWLLPRKVSSFAYPTQSADLAEARATVAAALQPSAAGQASAYGPGVVLALAAKGALAARDGHCDEAGPIFQAALAIEPDSIAAQTGRVECQGELGHFSDVVAGLENLLRVDPESPRNKARAQKMGLALIMLGRATDAVSWLQRAASGDPEPQPGANDLGRVEWGRLLLIAALQQSGDHAGAVALYARYAAVWPHRTVWLLGSEFTQAQAKLPNFPPLLAAWRGVGMPPFADEHADTVADDPAAAAHRPIDPTPAALANIPTIDTAALLAATHSASPPKIVDFGSYAAVPAGADISDADPSSAADMDALAHRLGVHPNVVVMGRGPYDWTGVSVARQLLARGLRVAWYRGGEEAWAGAGYGARDMRSP